MKCPQLTLIHRCLELQEHYSGIGLAETPGTDNKDNQSECNGSIIINFSLVSERYQRYDLSTMMVVMMWIDHWVAIPALVV